MITLRPYQQELIDATREALRRNRGVIMQSAVGTGKTAMASFMLKSALERNKRVIFAVPRIALLHQTSNTLNEIGIPHGYIWADKEYCPEFMCHVASIDTLHRRLDKIEKPDFLVVDECKHTPAKSYRKIVQWMDGYIVGLDATPQHEKGFEGLFDEIVCGKPIRWHIDNGNLSDYRIFAPPVIDRKALHTRNGEFIAEEVEQQVLVGNPVTHWMKYAKDKRTIMFTPTVKSSQEMVLRFISAGIPAAHMDADTPIAERMRIINQFADGEIKIISNVGLMIEGFDLSATIGRIVPVEAVIFNTATKSLTKWMQAVGRGLRYKPYPAIILDHGGNCVSLGMPDEEHDWSLEGKKKHEITPVTQCKKCYHVYRPAPKCPECGYVAPVKERKLKKPTEGELIEMTAKINYESDCRTLQHWHILAKKLGKKPGWAYMRWKQRRWKPNLNHA